MNDNKITCGVCRDLLPLVKDGVASADSEAAVRQHIGGCNDCAMLFDGKFVPAVEPSESPKALLRFKHRLTGVYTALMMLGIYFGLSLTASEDLFFNCLIMPIVGIFGYLAFRWKSLYAVPVILLIVQAVINALGFIRGAERLGFLDLLIWVFLYSLFALGGIVAAMFFGFAFGKRKSENGGETVFLKQFLFKHLKTFKVIAAIIAFILTAVMLWFVNALLGNPVSYFVVKNNAEKYVAENYAAEGYVLKDVSYSFKDGDYYAYVAKPNSLDCRFTVKYRLNGRLILDLYEGEVLKGGNVQRRLEMSYRELVDSVLESPAYPYSSDIAFGSLEWDYDLDNGYTFAGIESPLVPDALYDIKEVGAKAGKLTIYIDAEEMPTCESTAETLLELSALMERGGVEFYAIDLSFGSVYLEKFLRSDIYEDGLVERVKANYLQYAERETEKWLS